MFIVGGFNVYPAEVENLLTSHERVAQAAVVGVPDERMGEVGVAYVIPRLGGERRTADPEQWKSELAAELIDWSAANMANFKAPRRIEIVDSLPTNPAGKVLRYELRERATGGSNGA
jgi:acyl-CoA synthetase (AMP-forming)/AMP-acid ligase II